MRSIAIVQARMGSSRLPGKVLQDICGATMLERVHQRLSQSVELSDICFATTTLTQDDTLQQYCSGKGWQVFRGDAEDVLDRYYHAALATGAELVVRVTSDCPLIDAAVVDDVVRTVLQDKSSDYASNVHGLRTFPRGLDVEAFPLRTLQMAWELDRDPASREHVTPYIYKNPALFRLLQVRSQRPAPQYRLTVDTQQDLDVVRHVYAHFAGSAFDLNQLLDLLDNHPEWAALNAEVPQKAMEFQAPSAQIREESASGPETAA